MDSEFIGTRELILGGIGIGAALILLVLLSLLQTGRMKREGQARLDKLKDDNAGAGDAPPGATPFFVCRYIGNNARFFRAYQSAEELLFVHAGEYFVLIDTESVRGTDDRHWLWRSLKMVYVGLGAVAVGGVMVMAVILRGVARNVHKNPEAAGDIVLIVLGIIAFLAAIAVVGIPLTLWGITKRCQALDGMSLANLRNESELHPKSLRATPETVSEIKVKFLDLSAQFFASHETACSMTFKHVTRGKWTIDTLTLRDTREAVPALLAIWGRDRVHIDSKLQERLGLRTVEAPPSEAVAVTSIPSSPGVSSTTKETKAATTGKAPPYGFRLEMLIGCLIGGGVAVLTAVTMSAAAGRFSYTGLWQLLIGFCACGTYLGHVAGALRHKETGVNPFDQLSPGVMVAGALIWFLGAAGFAGAVLGIMTALYGLPPH